jgi:actin
MEPYLIPTSIGFPKSKEDDIFFIGKDAEDLNNHLDLIYPIKNGIFYDWDNLEKLLGFIFEKELKIDPRNHLIILTESHFNNKENREKLVELIFEKFNFPALCIENKAVLNCYSYGKSSGLNINISESGTYIVPVFEGFKLDPSKIKYDIGGQTLTEYMAQLLNEINPKFLNNSFKTTVEDIKHKVCFCCSSSEIFNEKLKDHFNHPFDYELPDGCKITIKEPRFKCPEIIFQPSLIYKIGDNLPLSCWNSIEKCDEDIRELLLENIILTGGSSKITNLKERLYYEMKACSPPDMKEKIKIGKNFSKENECWDTASILGQLSYYDKIIYSTDYLVYDDYNDNYNSVIQRYTF